MSKSVSSYSTAVKTATFVLPFTFALIVFSLVDDWPAPLTVVLAATLTAALIAYNIPGHQLERFAKRTYHYGPVVLGFISVAFFGWFAETVSLNPPGEFFEAAAQVLPLLMLTTVVDVRRSDQLEARDLLLTLLVLMLGEVAALLGIVYQDRFIFVYVCASLTAGFAALALSIAAAHSRSGLSSSTTDGSDDAQ